MSVRAFNGSEADTLAVMDMAERFYLTTHYASIGPFSHDAVVGIVKLLHDTGILLLAQTEDEIVGMIGMIVSPLGFSPGFVGAHEVMWYITPEAQGNGAGKALLAAIEPACKGKGVDFIQMAHLHSSPKQAGEIFARMGYAPTEHFYSKVI